MDFYLAILRNCTADKVKSHTILIGILDSLYWSCICYMKQGCAMLGNTWLVCTGSWIVFLSLSSTERLCARASIVVAKFPCVTQARSSSPNAFVGREFPDRDEEGGGGYQWAGSSAGGHYVSRSLLDMKWCSYLGYQPLVNFYEQFVKICYKLNLLQLSVNLRGWSFVVWLL